ncbi:MAG TPA: phosphotransferase family protein [Limnobacter sp.]|nr:phosphotransferase family protein [Limnobacter sp.]
MDREKQENLSRHLAMYWGAQRVDIAEVMLLSGGAIQENWSLELHIHGGPMAGQHACVLRCDSPTAGVAISHGRAQEYALLKTVFDAGVTVPEPLLLCTDVKVLGRPFFLMRKIAGTAAGHVLVKDMRYAPDRVELAHRLGREMATIHSIKPPAPALEFLPLQQGNPALLRVRKHRQYLDSIAQPHPVLEWGLRWLERHAPEKYQIALCHGDFRTGNYMVDEQGLTGILDWEFASWSEPLEDIAWFCAQCWRFGQNHLEAGGVGMREHFYAGYEQVSSMPIVRDQVRYWEVMAHVTWAVIALQQAQRHCSGQERSLLLALTGHIVPELEWQILNMTEHD